MSGFTGAIQLVYVLAAACFVIGLHLMNSPATASRGNQVSMAGMIIAVVATLVLLIHDGTVTAAGWIVMISGVLIGSAIGLYAARTVQMTAMPQLVSAFNAFGGGAAALIAIAMPAVDTWLPRLAVAGEFIRCRPMTKQAAAST